MEDKIYDMEDDFEEYGREEERQKELMKGIKKFESRTIFKTNPSDEEFLRYQYDNDLSNLIEFGHFSEGKLTQMTRFSQPLKNIYRAEGKTDIISQKAVVPTEGTSQPPSVKGKDDRKRVGDSIVEFPQTAIGYLQVEFNDNSIIRGTGSMIGPNHVLTAAHNVYSRAKPNKKIVKINFFAGLKQDQLSFKPVAVSRVILLEKHKAPVCKSPEESDLCVLILQEPLGLTTGWFGLLNPEKFDAVTRNFEIYGYPTDKPDLIQHSVSTKGLKQPNKDMLEYENGACSGMNGGPISVSRAVSATSIEHYIIGIHLKERSATTKVGVRLTKEKFDEISEIVSFFYLQDSLDDSFYASTMSLTTNANISFDFCKTSRTRQLNNAVHALRFNPQLTSISVRSKTTDNLAIVTDETLELLEQSSQAMRRLKQLKLEFFDSEKLTDKGLKLLSKFISGLTDLTHFTFLLTNHSGKGLSSNVLKEILGHIGRMPNLISLNVTLNNLTTIDDEPLKALSASIFSASSIENLKLHFQTLPSTTEIGFTQLVGNIKSLQRLQKLSVTLFGFRFSDTIKQTLKTTFKNLPHLSVL